jgi:membrane protein required for colicin V production
MNLTNPLDIGIVIIFGFFLVRGFFKGFVREIFSLIGFLGGFYGACTYYLETAKFLSKWISPVAYLNIVSFVLIFLGVFILISLLGAAIKFLLDIVFLGWIDRVLGVLTGFIKGILIVSVLLMAFAIFFPEWKPLMATSTLAPKITIVAQKMASVIPRGVKRQLTNNIQKFKEAWKPSENK